MELAAIYTLLEGVDKVGDKKGTEVRDFIKAEVAKMNSQEQNLRTKHKTVLESLGLKPDHEDPAKEAKAIKAKADAVPVTADPTKSTEYSTLAERLKNLETEKEQEKRDKETEKAKNLRLTKENALTNALQKANVKYPEVVLPSLMDKVEIEVVDGKDVLKFKVGADKKTLDDGLKDFLKDKPGLIGNTVKPGSGSAPVTTTQGGGGEVKVSPEEKLRRARAVAQ